ncbi:MAG: hypothetical protein IPO63_10230 [Bacteroidetes bacterium]|nr:hypothetical protein [Bacteroidota bacterium]
MNEKATKKIQVEFQNKKKLSEEIDIALNWLESQELTPEEIAKKIRLEKKNYRFSKADLSTTRNLKDKNKITVAFYSKEKLQNILQQLKLFIENEYKFTWNESLRNYEDVNKKFIKTLPENHLDINWKAKASKLQGTWKGISFKWV